LRTGSGVRMEQSTSSICSSRTKKLRQALKMFAFSAHPIGPKSNWPVIPIKTQMWCHVKLKVYSD